MRDPLKIDIVVNGRFHAFSLGAALLRAGHDVIIYTNYPKHIVRRWGVPAERVRSHVFHGIISRLMMRIRSVCAAEWIDCAVHSIFSKWVARMVRRDSDVLYGFSGVMEHVLATPRRSRAITVIARSSAHIEVQARILREEQARCGEPVERPSEWMIRREKREYAAADIVLVPSQFALDSFLSEGNADIQRKVRRLSLGVEVRVFNVSPATYAERVRRIQNGEAIRVLTVGTFSFRKGALDFVKIAARQHQAFRFRFVGDVARESRRLYQVAKSFIEFVPRIPEAALLDQYAWADVFVFPTLEDGFAVVLAQAAAAGLPIIATTNCGARDIVKENCTGWIVAPREPDSISHRLDWCHSNRAEFLQIVGNTSNSYVPRSWDDVASEFAQIMRGCLRS